VAVNDDRPLGHHELRPSFGPLLETE